MAEYEEYYISGGTYVIQKRESDEITDLVLMTGPDKDGSSIVNTINIGGQIITKKRYRIKNSKYLTASEVIEVVSEFGPDISPQLKRSIGDHLRRNLRVSTEIIEQEFNIDLSTEHVGVKGGIKRTKEIK